MAEFDPIDINFLINKNEVRRDAEDVKREIRGVALEAEAVTAKANKQTAGLIYGDDAAKKEAQRIVDLQKHYAELQRKIQANTDKRTAKLLPPDDEVKKTTDAIGNAADKVAELGTVTVATSKKQDKSKQSTTGMIGSLIGWTAALNIGLQALQAYGPEILDYIKNMFGFEKASSAAALSIETLNKAFNSNDFKKGVANIIELREVTDLAKDGFVDQSVAIDKYNDLIGNTAGTAKNLADVEQGLIDNADAYIEMTFKKAAANLALQEAAKKAVEAEKRRNRVELSDFDLGDQVELLTNIAADGSAKLEKAILGTDNISALQKFANELFGTEIDVKKAEQQAENAAKLLEKEGDSFIAMYAKIMKEAAAAAKKLKTSVFDPSGKDAKKIFEQRKKLLEQIASLDREYNRKQLTTNEAELQAITDKFDKIRKLVQDFNSDPKNSKATISLAGLNDLEDKTKVQQRYKQETKELKKEIEEQKRIYEEYEDYKATFGNEAARQKYAEQIKDFESFADKLKDLKEKNKDAFAAFNSGTATANQTERVEAIATKLNKETDEQLKAYQEQLANLLSFNQEKKLAIEKFEAFRKQAIAAGDEEAIKVAEERLQEELDLIDDANVKKTAAYKELFGSTARLTIKTGNQLIANAKKLLETQNISAELRAKILRLIAETEKEVQALKYDDIFDYADAVGRLGSALTTLTGNDSSALSQIGRGLSGLASGAKNLLTVLDKESSTGAKIGSATSAFVQIVGIIIDSAKQRKQADVDYYNAALGYQNDYNLALQDQVRLQAELNENPFITDYKGRFQSGLEAVKTATEGYQKALKSLDEAKVKAGTKNTIDGGSVLSGIAGGAVIGAAIGSAVPVLGTIIGGVVGGIIGIFAGKKKKDQFVSLLSEYPDILERTETGVLRVNKSMAQNLIANNQVNDKTKEILGTIIDWGDKIEEAREQIDGVVEELAGQLGDDIRNDLVEAFQAGEDAAIRMGDTIEGVLENVVAQLLFNEVFGTAFDKLKEGFNDTFNPLGGDGTVADELAAFFTDAKDLSKVFNQGLEDAQKEAGGFGLDIFQPDESSQQNEKGLAGAIRRELTEETGSELTGLFRNQLDTTKGHFELAQKSFDLDQRNYDATLSVMRNTAMIEENTRNTVTQLTMVVGRLDTISKNTKKDQSGRDLGLTA